MKTLIEFIMDNPNNRKESIFKKYFPKEYTEILQWNFPNDFKFSQKLYHYINNDKQLLLGICSECKCHRCQWRGFGIFYLKYCSRECCSKSSIHKENIKNGMYNRTEKEKQITRDKIKQIKNSLTQEEKHIISQKRIETLNKKGFDFINEYRIKQKNSLKNTLKSRTKEEKQKDSERKSIIWKNKPKDKKEKHLKKNERWII